jgi:hypothetical protein
MEPPASATYMRVAVETTATHPVVPGSLVWAGHGQVVVKPRGTRAPAGNTASPHAQHSNLDCMPLVHAHPPSHAVENPPDRDVGPQMPLGVAFDVPTALLSEDGAPISRNVHSAIAIAVAGVATVVQRATKGLDAWPVSSTYPGCFLTVGGDRHSHSTKTSTSRTVTSIGMILDVQLPSLALTYAQRKADLIHLRVLML